MMSLKARITQADRKNFGWSSAGVVKKTIKKRKGPQGEDVVNVWLAGIQICVHKPF